MGGTILFAAGVLAAAPAAAQDVCEPGDEACTDAPPCYREPDNPDCNPDCHCGSPDYPECDPYCEPGDLCDPDCGNPCWDEFEGDVCNDDRDPCEPTDAAPIELVDDMDGTDDGQIGARADVEPEVSCATLYVDRTGYYEIFDTELSESCSDQLDETGFLTIDNSCNEDGWPLESNAGDRYLVLDSDNTRSCSEDSDCDADQACRTGYGSTCCAPDEPTFMGTFLLMAGEPNRICLHAWCPVWREEVASGTDYGFVVDGCDGTDSVHFRLGATALACEDDTRLPECARADGEGGDDGPGGTGDGTDGTEGTDGTDGAGDAGAGGDPVGVDAGAGRSGRPSGAVAQDGCACGVSSGRGAAGGALVLGALLGLVFRSRRR